MSFRGDLIKAGIDSDGVNIDVFRPGAQIRRAGVVGRFMLVEEIEIDCSANTAGDDLTFLTLPPGSVLFSVETEITEEFDGDATTTFIVGVAGTTNKYIADSTAGTGGTVTQDTVVEYAEDPIALLATWVNTANATEGKVKVRVIYSRP